LQVRRGADGAVRRHHDRVGAQGGAGALRDDLQIGLAGADRVDVGDVRAEADVELAALQLRHRLRGTGDRLELDIEALGLEQAAPYRDLQGRGVRDRHRADGELRLLQVGAGRLRVVAAPR